MAKLFRLKYTTTDVVTIQVDSREEALAKAAEAECEANRHHHYGERTLVEIEEVLIRSAGVDEQWRPLWEPPHGMLAEAACRALQHHADETKSPVSMIFNDTKVTAAPGGSAETLLRAWKRQRGE